MISYLRYQTAAYLATNLSVSSDTSDMCVFGTVLLNECELLISCWWAGCVHIFIIAITVAWWSIADCNCGAIQYA